MLIRRYKIRPLNVLLGALVMFLGSFRVIAIPFVLLNAVRSTRRRSRFNTAVQIGFLLTILSPIDLGLPFMVTLTGVSGEGIRVVRSVDNPRSREVVTLRPRATLGIYHPTWWVIWWKHDSESPQ